ncbi:MAG: EAL domain-containing protein, partial [Gammaproteobacteria bacterium]|nr:EAL domain-containing protein [Gammaproteobacteria bacterium]
ALTGLPNRVMLREYLDFVIGHASRQGQNVAVMFIDLDDFKIVNDTLGHDAGDWLLKEVSERIKGCVRQEDYVTTSTNSEIEAVVSRHGGDEFTVLLPHVREPMNAATVANRIIEAVSAPFVLKGQEVIVGASVGIAVYPNNGTNVDMLLKNADIAMYQAKQDGKNSYKFYSDTMNIRALHKLSLETDLRKALDKGQLELWYQPQIALESGKVIGAEALLRWNHPKRGIVSPNEFIPIAERLGLITRIGEWVIQQASKQAKVWHSSILPDINMAVNVSSIQFRRQDVTGVVQEALKKTGLDSKNLHLEITETGLIFGDRKAVATLNKLREIGVEVWVDDFGTGYSSLNYLRQFPVNGVKIDRSFIKDIDSDENDRSLVSAIISMSHSLGLRVVAEGVETAEQLQILNQLECDTVQGYFLGKPMTATNFEQTLAKAMAKKAKKIAATSETADAQIQA